MLIAFSRQAVVTYFQLSALTRVLCASAVSVFAPILTAETQSSRRLRREKPANWATIRQATTFTCRQFDVILALTE
jgi:hypothetical protein